MTQFLFAGAPVILAGDFNAEPDGEEFAVMRERKDYVNYTEGIGVTYMASNRKTSRSESITSISEKQKKDTRGLPVPA